MHRGFRPEDKGRDGACAALIDSALCLFRPEAFHSSAIYHRLYCHHHPYVCACRKLPITQADLRVYHDVHPFRKREPGP
jgi:hypothetical protein